MRSLVEAVRSQPKKITKGAIARKQSTSSSYGGVDIPVAGYACRVDKFWLALGEKPRVAKCVARNPSLDRLGRIFSSLQNRHYVAYEVTEGR